MLLNEIIQVDNTDTFTDRNNVLDSMLLRGNDRLKHGALGYYRRSPNDYKMGLKSNLRPFTEDKLDAYYVYIKTIQNEASGNPWYPRVYAINTTKDKQNTISYNIKIEHLKEFKELTSEEIINLAQNIFHEDDVKRKFKQNDTPVPNYITASNLAQMVRDVVRGKIQTTDDKLIEAAKLINQLIKKYNFVDDITFKNIMVRRTQYGYQLVLVDPLV